MPRASTRATILPPAPRRRRAVTVRRLGALPTIAAERVWSADELAEIAAWAAAKGSALTAEDAAAFRARFAPGVEGPAA